MSKSKTDLIEAMSQAADISKAAAERALDAYTDYVIATVKGGDKVSIIGFGSFESSQRSARQGRNPQTGAAMQIAAATVPKFKAGKKFKDAVNV